MARNPKAYITLRGRAFEFSCWLGNGPAVVTGGGAEYEAGRRPRADAVTMFTGNALITLDVPVLFDGWPDKDIQPRVDQILALCVGKDRRPPPNFKATGPIPFSGERFQMSMPEWGEGNRDERGRLVRQALTLKLIQYSDPSTIAYRKKRLFGRGTTITAPQSIVLRQPMNMLQIAARYFDDPDEAARLGRLNGVADLRKKLPVGRRIKLGVGSDLSVIEAK